MVVSMDSSMEINDDAIQAAKELRYGSATQFCAEFYAHRIQQAINNATKKLRQEHQRQITTRKNRAAQKKCPECNVMFNQQKQLGKAPATKRIASARRILQGMYPEDYLPKPPSPKNS